MEFAGEALISLESSKDLQPFRFTSPRSDLSRHQSHINLRNLSAIPTPVWLVDLLRGASHVTLLVRTVMGQERPDRARHLVGERHYHRIERSACEQLLKPWLTFLALGNRRAGAVNQQRAQINVAPLADAEQLHPTAAVAVSNPTPGMAISFLLATSFFFHSPSRFSI